LHHGRVFAPRERVRTTGESSHHGREFAQRERVCTTGESLHNGREFALPHGQIWYLTTIRDTPKRKLYPDFRATTSRAKLYYVMLHVICYDACYIFLYMEHVMVHVSCSAGRRGSCIYALRRVRAPRAAGLQPLIEQGCATRGGWRILVWLIWSKNKLFGS
jgi:hypothetical protein